MKLKMIYVYDPLCGWCYGFSPVIRAISESYGKQFEFEVISGGMMLGPDTGPVSVVAPFIQQTYKEVENISSITFGEGFLRQLDKGDMIFDSEKPSVALSVFKSYQPENAVLFAHDMQQCIYYDGMESNKDEMYRYLSVNFGIDPDQFVHKMHEEEFKQGQLQTSGFPAVFIQSSDNHFYMIAKGFATMETMELRITNVLKELNG